MSRTPLMRLTAQGLAAIDATFLEGDPERLPDNPSFVTPIVGHGAVELDALRFDLPAQTLGPGQDPTIAMQIHTRLGIRRGVATEPRMWAWLASRHASQLLRRRWSTESRPANRSRFAGRLVEHGLARLWWAAELTQEQGADQDTHRRALAALMSSQYRTDRLLSTAALRHPPALLGVLDAIKDDIRWQVLNQICRRLGLMATTYTVSAMSRAQVRALVGELYRAVIAERDYDDDEAPSGV